MLKYYILLFLVAVIVLSYSYFEDPCNNRFRADFSSKYPSYEILSFGYGERDSGDVSVAPDGGDVYCQISYQKPDSEQTYEDIWLYRDFGRGGNYSSVSSHPVD